MPVGSSMWFSETEGPGLAGRNRRQHALVPNAEPGGMPVAPTHARIHKRMRKHSKRACAHFFVHPSSRRCLAPSRASPVVVQQKEPEAGQLAKLCRQLRQLVVSSIQLRQPGAAAQPRRQGRQAVAAQR